MLYHPEYIKLMQSFMDIDCLKFAAYRTALKIRKIQKITKMHYVDINDISAVFENSDFHKNNSTLTWEEVEPMLITLYDVTTQRFRFTEEFSNVKIILNFLHSTFCSKLGDSLKLYQMKLLMAVLCGAKLAEKYKYIIHIFTVSGFISQEHLYLMLHCFAKICENIGEKASFGLYLVPATVLNCLHFCNESNKITEISVNEWLFHEPQTLAWLSTHHRLAASENVKHDVKCRVCKCSPFFGLRYKCLHCFSYNLCQQCFLLGFGNKNHEHKHVMQELCQKASGWLETKTVLTVIRNTICLPRKYKRSYLPCSESDLKDKSDTPKTRRQINGPLFSDGTFNWSVHLQELSSVIEKFETENRQRCKEVKGDCSANFETGVYQNSICGGQYMVKQEVFEKHCCDLESMMLRLHNLLLDRKTFRTIQHRKHISPELKIPLNIDGYYESTPIMCTADQPSMQQNLSAFLKYHYNVSGFENVCDIPSNSCQEVLLYSSTDISVRDKKTECEVKNRKSAKVISYDTLSSNSSGSVNKSSAGMDKISTETKLKFNTSSNCEYFHCNQFSNARNFQAYMSGEENSTSDEITENSSNTLKFLTPRVNSASSFSKVCIPEESILEMNFTNNMDCELQQLLDQLESFCPKITGVHLSSEKSRLLHALSEMEMALKKSSSSSLPNQLK